MKVNEAFETEILGWPGVTRQWMFGCDCYLAKGKMFGFWLEGGPVLIGLCTKSLDEVYAKFGAGPLVSGDRVIKKWAFIPVRDRRRLAAIMPYVKESYESALKRSAGKSARR